MFYPLGTYVNLQESIYTEFVFFLFLFYIYLDRNASAATFILIFKDEQEMKKTVHSSISNVRRLKYYFSFFEDKCFYYLIKHQFYSTNL